MQKAFKLYEKDKVHIRVGPIAGHEAVAVSAVLTPKKKLLIETFGGNASLVGKDCSPYTFLLGHTTCNVTVPMAPFLRRTLGRRSSVELQAAKAESARAAMKKSGATFIEFSDAARAKWARKMPNIPMEWAASMEQKGLPGKTVVKAYLDGLRKRGVKLVRDRDKE